MSHNLLSFGIFGPPELPAVIPTTEFTAQIVEVQQKNIEARTGTTIRLWDGARSIGITKTIIRNSLLYHSLL